MPANVNTIIIFAHTLKNFKRDYIIFIGDVQATIDF